MMNSHSTSKIVVGIGLAVVFGIGVSVFAVRAKQESQLARNAPAPALAAPTDQNASGATAPNQSAASQTPTDQTATPSSAPPAVPPAVAPTPVASAAPTTSNVMKDNAATPASDASKPTKSKASDRADRHVAKTRNSSEPPATRVASAANSNTSPSDAGATANTQQGPAQTGEEAATSAGPAATSSEPAASDSQITAYVKSEIATAAPNSNVKVTTTNGIVALAGSVVSQDAVDQARQAAQRVAGVRQVDASALTVSNQ
jgi:hyperosmotically inducible periplasmic protein